MYRCTVQAFLEGILGYYSHTDIKCTVILILYGHSYIECVVTITFNVCIHMTAACHNKPAQLKLSL